MFQELLRKLNLVHEPVSYKHGDILDAWEKVNAVLKTANTEQHVDAAQRIFNSMLNYFGFTEEQSQAPIIHDMQNRIVAKRAEIQLSLQDYQTVEA
ncbi:hypothetical protein Xoosp13_66 [Xanthomonas phage Xoo-sp13]|nr:hypothetical protein Xoosp13_66 [Xanthomonas phage Xoo-sp13]